MTRYAAVLLAVLLLLIGQGAALAEKHGGILTVVAQDSPGGLSMLEEATIYSMGQMAGVFNNLIMFDQHVKQNSMDSIVPDLATGWSWSDDGRALILPLRQGVRFHDGTPLTSRDVLCTWALLLET